MQERIVTKVLRVHVVVHHREHIFELSLPRLTGVDRSGQVAIAIATAIAVLAHGVGEVVVAKEVLHLVEVLAQLVQNLSDAPCEALGFLGVLLQRLLLSEAVVVELGDALVLTAERRVGTLGSLLLDDILHLFTELALLGANGVFYHTAVGDSGHIRKG